MTGFIIGVSIIATLMMLVSPLVIQRYRYGGL